MLRSHVKFVKGKSDMGNSEINIEKIMNDIKTEIKEKGYTADMLSFEEVTNLSVVSVDGFDSNAFSGVVSYMNTSYNVPITRPLSGNPIIVFIKRVLRKLTRFTLRPIVEHQSEYNCYSAKAFAMMENYMKAGVTIAELNKKVEMLELKLQTAAKEIDQLNFKIAELENK